MQEKIEIDKELFTQQIIDGKTIVELMEIWDCSRSTITLRKKEWDLIGLSPNSKKVWSEDGATKLCKTCGEFKNLKDFYSNGVRNGKQRWKPSCILCESAHRRNSKIILIKECLLEQNREYKCELCGYDRNHSALAFHHSTDEKNFEIGHSVSIGKERLLYEISICQLLCQNCHHEVHNPMLMNFNS